MGLHKSSLVRIFPPEVLNSVSWQIIDGYNLKAGDVVKVRVKEKKPGILNRLELIDNTVIELLEGDEFIGVIGSRSAIDYLSGQPPVGDFNLVDLYTLNIGGVVGQVTDFTKGVSLPPSVEITAFGLLNGQCINTINYYLTNQVEHVNFHKLPRTIVVIGDGRSSGKTTTVAKIVTVLKEKNFKVGSAKLTGIGRKRDILEFSKNGSDIVTDFIDCGLPSSVIDKLTYTKVVSKFIDNTFLDSYFWVCELGGGLLSEYNVETALGMLNDKTNVVAYVICAKTRTSTYGCYKILTNILENFGKSGTEIFISGAITNSYAGILSVSKYAPMAPVLKVFEDDNSFYKLIKHVVE